MKPKEKHDFLRLYNVHKTYKVISEVGSGTYGRVYKAISQKTGKYVALKKIDTSRQEMDGFPITAIREVKLLRMLNHRNIIALLEIIMSRPSSSNKFRGSTYLVFEYMDHDFMGLMTIKYRFKLPEIKCIMRQMIEGLKYLHENKIIHRDMKSANILLNNLGEVKIADFGLARQFANTPQAYYTNKVVTLWYRAPELLLGSTNYNTQIDMWSVGCIFAELLTGEILFKGDKEPRQLELIYEICGSPTTENWPEVEKLEYFGTLGPKTKSERKILEVIKSKKPDLDTETMNFLDGLLILDPKKRLSADQALMHQFFKSDPLECSLKEMPKIDKECHDTLLRAKKTKREDVIKLDSGKQLPIENPSNSKKTPINNDHTKQFYREFSKGEKSTKTQNEEGQKGYFSRGYKPMGNNGATHPNRPGGPFYKKTFHEGGYMKFPVQNSMPGHMGIVRQGGFYKGNAGGGYQGYRKNNFSNVTEGESIGNFKPNQNSQINIVEKKPLVEDNEKQEEITTANEGKQKLDETIEALRSQLPAGGLKYLIQNSALVIAKDEVKASLKEKEILFQDINKDEDSAKIMGSIVTKIEPQKFESIGTLPITQAPPLIDKNILNDKKIKRKERNEEMTAEKTVKKIHLE